MKTALIQTALYQSPIGRLEISANESSIVSILFAKKTEIENLKHQKYFGIIEICVAQLDEYFEGKRKVFMLNCQPSGTDFQLKVWKILSEIPYGKTITYKSQSILLGDVKAIRAMASCNGKNPLSIVIPCHRVLGSNGDLTGYAGGLQNKKWLIDHEQKFTSKAIIQQKIFEVN